MGYRGRLAYIALRHRCRRVRHLQPGQLCPHRRHRNVGPALYRHTVGQVEPSVLVRLEVRAHAVLLGNTRRILVHTVYDQFSYRRAPVEEKLLAPLSALDELARQYR